MSSTQDEVRNEPAVAEQDVIKNDSKNAKDDKTVEVTQPKRRGRKPKAQVDVPPTESTDKPVEAKPPKPKRQCSEKQLAALAAGRARNRRYKPRELIDTL